MEAGTMATREFMERNGEKFWIQSSGRYYQSGRKNVAERLLHRRVWSDAHGPIPAGMHVHHRDGDWRNNALENLELVVPRPHRADHMRARNTADPARHARSLDAAQRA